MDPQRRVRSLFELKEAEFVGSVTGITNGKEGLRQMLEELRLEDDHNDHEAEGQVTAVTPLSVPQPAGDVVGVVVGVQEPAEGERGLTCRTCEVAFSRSVSFFLSFCSFSFFASSAFFFCCSLVAVWRSRGTTSSWIGTGAT